MSADQGMGQFFSRKILSMGLLSLALASCAAPTAKVPEVGNDQIMGEIRAQLEIAAREKMAQVKRVNGVATALVLANAPICGKKIIYHSGFSTATRQSFGEDMADAMTATFGIQSAPTIYMVHAGTDAFGKLREGDVITAINGKATGNKFTKIAEIVGKGNAFTLDIKRDNKHLNVTIMPARACLSRFYIDEKDEIDASANGAEIYISAGMLRLLPNDEELAMVLGHELAHNIRLHLEAGEENVLTGALLGTVVAAGTGVDLTDWFARLGEEAYSQEFESEADYVGLYYMARAGYDITNAPNFMRRIGAVHTGSIHLSDDKTHPSTAKRYLSLNATIREIKGKQAKSLPLIPDEKRAGL